MSDVDLLVRSADLEKFHTVLKKCRWQLDHLYQVPGDFLRRLWKRLRITLNKY